MCHRIAFCNLATIIALYPTLADIRLTVNHGSALIPRAFLNRHFACKVAYLIWQTPLSTCGGADRILTTVARGRIGAGMRATSSTAIPSSHWIERILPARAQAPPGQPRASVLQACAAVRSA